MGNDVTDHAVLAHVDARCIFDATLPRPSTFDRDLRFSACRVCFDADRKQTSGAGLEPAAHRLRPPFAVVSVW
jgi:hypothetical protein